MNPSVPTLRIRRLTEAKPRADGAWVLYWMTAHRRLGWNHALDHSIATARELGKPLLILEDLRLDYPWASSRHHRFVMDGMAEHSIALRDTPVGYHGFVEREPGGGRGLLRALASEACCVVTDDSPGFFTPKLLAAAGRLAHIQVEAVDSCGLLPLRAADRPFSAAYHFRRFLQKTLPAHLADQPSAEPLRHTGLAPCPGVPEFVAARWPAVDEVELASHALLASLPVNSAVGPIASRGGTGPAQDRLAAFLESGLDRYAADRNHPDLEAGSGLSPWLHYGHISPHEVWRAIMDREGWSPLRLSQDADGRREGWWGVDASPEAFLDQLITWRELGFVYCSHVPDYQSWGSLPAWARATLEEHAADPREYVYSSEQFETAVTHDELWNAAQRQLVRSGVIHNYLRMLWGKKILEWSPHPREALEVMIELNNRYAADGRDPNSYSGIFWCLGRFDRGWPERPVFGKVRSMTSSSTRRKVRLDRYLKLWSE